MNKEFLKDLIELVQDEDVDLLHKIILKFIPEVPPELDEIEAFESEVDTCLQISNSITMIEID